MNSFDSKKFSDPKRLWNRKQKNQIHSNRIFDLVSWDAESPDGKIRGEFYGLETKDWVNVIPITKENKIILVEQYRHGLNSMSLELPGGICEFSGENSHLNAAKAELREETGFTSDNWKLIGKVGANPGILNNYSYTFLASNVEKTKEQDFDPHEIIDVVEVSFDEIPKLIRDGIFHHSLMVAALGLYMLLEKKNLP